MEGIFLECCHLLYKITISKKKFKSYFDKLRYKNTRKNIENYKEIYTTKETLSRLKTIYERMK